MGPEAGPRGWGGSQCTAGNHCPGWWVGLCPEGGDFKARWGGRSQPVPSPWALGQGQQKEDLQEASGTPASPGEPPGGAGTLSMLCFPSSPRPSSPCATMFVSAAGKQATGLGDGPGLVSSRLRAQAPTPLSPDGLWRTSAERTDLDGRDSGSLRGGRVCLLSR